VDGMKERKRERKGGFLLAKFLGVKIRQGDNGWMVGGMKILDESMRGIPN
jgi:hypothetical protein